MQEITNAFLPFYLSSDFIYNFTCILNIAISCIKKRKLRIVSHVCSITIANYLIINSITKTSKYLFAASRKISMQIAIG